MKKEIWFINKDCAPIEENGTFVRTVKQAQYFQDKGYSVKVVCSNRVHNSQIVHPVEKGYSEQVFDEVPFLFVESPAYHSNGINRIWSYIMFSFNVYMLRRRMSAPDVIVHTSRVPFDHFVFKYAQKVKAKYIVDVVDMWPMELEHFGYLKDGNPILKWFYSIEKRRYAKASHVVFSMEGYANYLKEKRWTTEQGGPIDLKRTHYVNNGIDLKEFHNNLANVKLEDVDLENDSIFKVIYLGSVRKANNLDKLLDAAKHLKKYSDIKILIYGDGTEREMLERRAKDESIDNVVFKQKWIDAKYVPYVLSKAGVNLLNYAANWAPYGGSMNKMMMSFASGKPIVCNAGMRYSPIRDNNIGIDKYFSSSEEYAEAILSIYNLPKDEYDKMCERTLQTVQEYDMTLLCENFQKYCEL